MEELLKQILKEVSGLKEGQQQLFEEVSGLKDEVSIIKTTMATKDDIDKLFTDSQEDIKAMLKHINKKTDILATLPSKEDIIDINSHLEVLNDRLFHQEATLKHLKAVK